MKRMISAALALSLLGGAALAQDHEHRRDGGGQEPRGGGAEPRGGPQGVRPSAPPAQQQRGPQSRGPDNRGPDNRGYPFRGQPPGGQPLDRRQGGGPRPGNEDQGGRDYLGGGRGDYRRPDDRGGDGRDGYRGGYRDGWRGQSDRGLRPGGYLADHGWRDGGRFRAPYYRYPSGWGYRSWAFGAFLPEVFLQPDYMVGDYWDYGLPAPPPGYHWIRVGPDALLVRYGDGYVLDAAYGLFY